MPDILQLEGKSIDFQGGISITKLYIVFSSIHLIASDNALQVKTRYRLFVPPVQSDNIGSADNWEPLRTDRKLNHSLTHDQYDALQNQDIPTLLQTMAPAFILAETTNHPSEDITPSTITWNTLKATLFP